MVKAAIKFKDWKNQTQYRILKFDTIDNALKTLNSFIGFGMINSFLVGGFVRLDDHSYPRLTNI